MRSTFGITEREQTNSITHKMSEQLELDVDDTEEEQTEEGLDKVIQAQEERKSKRLRRKQV